jgi:hypothetical protein
VTVGAWIKTLQQFDDGLEVIVRVASAEIDNLYIATKPSMSVEAGCTNTDALCIDMMDEDEGMEEVGRLTP